MKLNGLGCYLRLKPSQPARLYDFVKRQRSHMEVTFGVIKTRI